VRRAVTAGADRADAGSFVNRVMLSSMIATFTGTLLSLLQMSR
jgi:hypothetical protein